jgi:7,8-dihydropterin-6-yl-methyl-4-(beta-D-ribofuranosyl)aminobenzene 5'-phosphate synthase
VLSHWHRDHSGGLLAALRLIKDGRVGDSLVEVALPPDRLDYRGIMFDLPVSVKPDPTLDETRDAGGELRILDQAQTALDGMFYISGEIPRQTSYEGGISGGI